MNEDRDSAEPTRLSAEFAAGDKGSTRTIRRCAMPSWITGDRRGRHPLLLGAGLVVVVAAGLIAAGSQRRAGVDVTVAAENCVITTSCHVSWIPPATVSSKDWFGLYSSPSAPDSDFLAWRYTNLPFKPLGGVQPSVGLILPSTLTPGSSYQWRLFANDGFSRLGTSPTFAITRPVVSVTARADGANADLTQAVWQVAWSGIPAPSPRDWVGLYRVGATNTEFLAWQYTQTNDANDRMEFAFPFPANGSYTVRLFSDNTYFMLGESAPV